MDDIVVDDLSDATEMGKSFLKEGRFPERPLRLPDLNPDDRTERVSEGGLQYLAPGLNSGETAEYRETLATFRTNRDPATANSCIFRGWNYAAGAAQINAAYGSIGSGEEFGYQPPGSNNATWSETHIRFTPPGGLERRLFTGYGDWASGRTGIGLSGTEGYIRYSPLVGAPIDLISWQGAGMSVNGDGFSFPVNGQRYLQQLNATADAWMSLPYAGSEDEIIIGLDPKRGRIPPVQVRDVHFIPVAAADVIAPTNGIKLFWDSATDTLSAKNSTGTVFRYPGTRRL